MGRGGDGDGDEASIVRRASVRPLSGHCQGVGVRVTLLAGLNSEALSCQCQLSGLCQGVVRVTRPRV